MVDFRINETRQIGEVSKPRLPEAEKNLDYAPVDAVRNRTV